MGPILARWVGQAELWLSENRGRAKVGAAMAAVVGSLFTGMACQSIAQIPWSVDESSPRVLSEPPEFGKWGARYPIVVGELRYLCGGAETKGGRGRQQVAYNPEDPSECRLAINAGTPSLKEWSQLCAGLAGLACALALALWLFGALPAERGRRLIRFSSAGAALALMCVSAILTITQVLLYGGP